MSRTVTVCGIETTIPDSEDWAEAFQKYQPTPDSHELDWALVIGEVLLTSDPGSMKIDEDEIRDAMPEEYLPGGESVLAQVYKAILWGIDRGWWRVACYERPTGLEIRWYIGKGEKRYRDAQKLWEKHH